MCSYTQLRNNNNNTMCEVPELIHSEASSSFSDVASAYLIFLTLPVTTATVEWSFSKL